MSKNIGKAQSLEQKSDDSSAQLDNPPAWSSWNFQTKQRDWHQVIYDEMRSSYIKSENT
jgi:hypothetical protein